MNASKRRPVRLWYVSPSDFLGLRHGCVMWNRHVSLRNSGRNGVQRGTQHYATSSEGNEGWHSLRKRP
jgi:hypothetical protein